MPTDPKRKLGPNAKRLLAHKMSVDAIPAGGGLADGIKFLSSKESIISGRSCRFGVDTGSD